MGPLLAGVMGVLVGLLAAGLVAWSLYKRLSTAQARAARAERLAELGQLTGGLAHEIKNPLSTIQLNLQLLAEEFDPADATAQRVLARLVTVQREAGRLREILDDFLRYAGKMEIDRKPVDVHAMLQELVDFVLPQAQLQKVKLRLRPATTPLVFVLDQRLIKQALLNLMLNALQAMSAQGDGELLLWAEPTQRGVAIHVTDTGPGIAPDARHLVFNAYYSTKKAGTGLGLAISQRIVQEHGGVIRVESELGKGADFVLDLPQ